MKYPLLLMILVVAFPFPGRSSAVGRPNRYQVFDIAIEASTREFNSGGYKALFTNAFGDTIRTNAFQNEAGKWILRVRFDEFCWWHWKIWDARDQLVVIDSVRSRWLCDPGPLQTIPYNQAYFRWGPSPYTGFGTRLSSMENTLDQWRPEVINLVSVGRDGTYPPAVLEKLFFKALAEGVMVQVPLFTLAGGMKQISSAQSIAKLRSFFDRFGAFPNLLLRWDDEGLHLTEAEVVRVMEAVKAMNHYKLPIACTKDLAIGTYQHLTDPTLYEVKESYKAQQPVIVEIDQLRYLPWEYLQIRLLAAGIIYVGNDLSHYSSLEQSAQEILKDIAYYELDPDMDNHYIRFIDPERCFLSITSGTIPEMVMSSQTVGYLCQQYDPNTLKEVAQAYVSDTTIGSLVDHAKVSIVKGRSNGVGIAEQIHLSWSADPATTFAVTWSTISQDNAAEVWYRQPGTSYWDISSGTTSKSPGMGFLHKVMVGGLKPNTLYEYKVTCDRGVPIGFGPVHTVKTAPKGSEATFSFAFLSDTGLENRLDGNARAAGHVRRVLKGQQPLFILGGGDYAYANRDLRFGSKHEAIDEWFREYQEVNASIPFMAQYGNHEIYLDEKFEDWAPRFQHPKGPGNSKYYSFDVGPVHFVALCVAGKRIDDAMITWLKRDLSLAAEKGGWVVVYHHEPLYACGRSHPAHPSVTETLYPIYSMYPVDLVLTGHDQNFERTYQLKGGDPHSPRVVSREHQLYYKGEGLIHLKASPGGKRSETGNDFSKFTCEQQYFTAARDDNNHHIVLVEVKGQQSLTVSVLGINERSRDFRYSDQFRIKKP